MRIIGSGKRVYKGNLHMHTTQSDGRLSMEDALRLYRSHGYDFVAVTDHWKVNAGGMFDGMLVLRGVELDVMMSDQCAHIVGVGVDDALLARVERGMSAQNLADAVRSSGGRAILAHPAWSLNTVDFMKALRGVSLSECYNSFSGVPWNSGRADACAHLDLAAAGGALYRFVASDDSHRYTGEACMSYTMVEADSLTREGVLKALDAGSFYASQGPEIYSLTYEGDLISLECSPSSHIVFYSNLVWVRGRCRSAAGQTKALYQIDRARGERFVRVELIDAFGRRAWSSPVDVAGGSA